MTISKKSDTRLDVVTRSVTLSGTRPIMFDRYAGDNQTKLDWSQKIYLNGKTLTFPIINILSLLTAHNTNSAPKRLRDKRKYKDICNACLSFVNITNKDNETLGYIPFLKKGNEITVGKFADDVEPESGLYLHRSVARLDKGIPNPKERPVLPLPWELAFNIEISPNKEIKEQEIMNLISEAGLAIGLGTFRGVFGKFSIIGWD